MEAALALLERPRAIAVGGGTSVVADLLGGSSRQQHEIVDLQALGLDRIERRGGGGLDIGATVTLQQLVDSGDVPAVIREAARRERPSTLRNQATLGGIVATGEPDSELIAALLAHDAAVTIATKGVTPGHLRHALVKVLDEMLPLTGAHLVTTVSIDTRGKSAAFRTGRTEADRPIVAAVARVTPEGTSRLALCGVGDRPVLIGGLEEVTELEPPGDFRGSPDYRRALAAVLARRALQEVS